MKIFYGLLFITGLLANEVIPTAKGPRPEDPEASELAEISSSSDDTTTEEEVWFNNGWMYLLYFFAGVVALVVLTVIGQLIANLCGNCGKDKESGEVDVQQEQAEIQEDYQQTTQA